MLPIKNNEKMVWHTNWYLLGFIPTLEEGNWMPYYGYLKDVKKAAIQSLNWFGRTLYYLGLLRIRIK